MSSNPLSNSSADFSSKQGTILVDFSTSKAVDKPLRRFYKATFG